MAFAPHALRVEVEMSRDGAPVRVRDERGRFAYTGGAGSQAGLADRNRVLAAEAQKAIARNLQENILRPSVSTGRLMRATLDPKNIAWSRAGFAVGDPEFLDGSQAKYWRTIDQGTDHWRKPFVGSTFWASKRRAFGATVSSFDDDVSIAGPAWSRAGAATGGLANFLSPRAVNAMLRRYKQEYEDGDYSRKDPRLFLTRIKIRNDIRPKRYYLNGFRESGVIDKGVRSYFYEFSQHLPGGPGR